MEFYGEVTAGSLDGLPERSHALVLLVVKEDEGGEKRKEGRVQATAVMWIKNDKNPPVRMNCGQMPL